MAKNAQHVREREKKKKKDNSERNAQSTHQEERDSDKTQHTETIKGRRKTEEPLK